MSQKTIAIVGAGLAGLTAALAARRLGTHDTLTVMPFTNSGEVVPSERLAKSPGVVEVECAIHPRERAYITAFDSPYFAIADPSGAFTIDSVPPGAYRVMAWAPGMTKPIEATAQVAAGGSATVRLGR